MGRHSQQRQRSRSLSVGSVGSIGSNLDLSKSKVAKVVDQDRRAVNLKPSPKDISLSAPHRNKGTRAKESLDFLQFPSEDTGVSLSNSPDLGRSSDEHQNKRARTSKGENSPPRSRKAPIDETQNDTLNDQSAPNGKKSQRKVVVHRIKHSGASSKSIVCMCATPKRSKHNLLAIAREDGSIELRSVDQKFRFIGTVPGNQSKSVDTLTWVIQRNTKEVPTLIGASRDGSIFVVDFTTLRLKSITSSGGGGVFALQSLYQTSDTDSPLFAAGCEDGVIRIFQCHADKSLAVVSSIPTTGASVLSLAWRQMDGREESDVMSDLKGTYLYAGVSDGTIRTYTYSGGQNKGGSWRTGNRMTVETLGRQTNTRIWSLKLLKDWTLVSADSLGNVQFWDGRSGALEQTFKQTNENADVLDLAMSADECKVFASGVDSKVVCFERPAETSLYSNRRWVRSHAHRPHTHDVRSLVTCFTSQQSHQGRKSTSIDELKNELLCTGGMDMKLCVFRTLNFRRRRAKVFLPCPHKSPAFFSRDTRLLALVQKSTVDLYRIKESPRNLKKNRHVDVPESERKVGTVELRKRSNITCGAISHDGKFMVLCDPFSVSLFKLKHLEDGLIEPVVLPLDTRVHAVSCASFGDDMTLILAATDGKLTIFDINDDTVEKRETVSPKLREDVEDEDSSEVSSSSPLSVQSVETFGDGKWIATLSNTWHGSTIEVYKRERGNYSHWWTLPTHPVPISAINFLDQEEPKLAAGCLNFEAFTFDLESRETHDPRHKLERSDKIHFWKELGHRPDYPIQLSHHKANRDQLMMVASGMFLLIDLSQPAPTRAREVPAKLFSGRKRKQQDKDCDIGSEAIMSTRYAGTILLDFVDGEEILAVEQPYVNIIAELPSPLKRRIYGT